MSNNANKLYKQSGLQDYYGDQSSVRTSEALPQGDSWGLEENLGLEMDFEDDSFVQDPSNSQPDLAQMQQGKTTDPTVDFDDDFFSDLEGDIQGESGESQETSSRLENLIKQIEANSNLSQADKENYLKQVGELQNQTAVVTDEAGVIGLEEKLDDLQFQIEDLGRYPAAISRMSQQLGMDPDRLSNLFKRYGMDPNSEISIPDSRVESMLNDPEFADLAQVRGEFDQSVTAFQERVLQLQTAANNWNALNMSDRDQALKVDASFRDLYDESIGEGEGFKAVEAAAEKLAQKTAEILSAMTGENVIAIIGEEDKAGFIQVGSQEVNVMADVEDPRLNFNGGSLEVPDVELVPLYADTVRDGQTEIPEWMKEEGYPIEEWDKETFWEKAKDFVSDPFKRAWNHVTDPVGAIKNDLKDGWNKVKSGVSKLKFW